MRDSLFLLGDGGILLFCGLYLVRYRDSGSAWGAVDSSYYTKVLGANNPAATPQAQIPFAASYNKLDLLLFCIVYIYGGPIVFSSA